MPVSRPTAPAFADASPNPDVVEIMIKAYRLTCGRLHDKGQPALVREVIAARVAEIAEAGERDPDRICERVMAGLGLQL
jgi:hypothetical protein